MIRHDLKKKKNKTKKKKKKKTEPYWHCLIFEALFKVNLSPDVQFEAIFMKQILLGNLEDKTIYRILLEYPAILIQTLILTLTLILNLNLTLMEMVGFSKG